MNRDKEKTNLGFQLFKLLSEVRARGKNGSTIRHLVQHVNNLSIRLPVLGEQIRNHFAAGSSISDG